MAEKSTTTERNIASPAGAVRNLLADLKKDRDREVVIGRFGLSGGEKQTLEKVGQRLGVTRERVRQIEKAALDRIKQAAYVHIKPYTEKALELLENHGGFAGQHQILHEAIGAEDLIEENNLRFILLLSDKIVKIEEDIAVKAAYSTKKFAPAEVKKWSAQLVGALEEIAKPTTKTIIIEGFKAVAPNLTDEQILSLLLINKQVRSTDSLWGLAGWREVNPKSIRDKTYIVLKRSGKPLHFTEIAASIKSAGFDGRSVTVQAVHNELIKDSRFILIGRGIYALSEWGYTSGTVADIIETVLRDAGGPLHKGDIIKRVLEHRIVKESTIVLNLQEKTKFKRISKATYTLAAS